MSRTGWLTLLIILSVSAAFARLGAHEFTGWDDPQTIAVNPHFNPPTFHRLSWYWTAIGSKAPAGLYIPFTYTVWAVLAKFAYLQSPDEFGVRLNPYLFHTANVVLHVLAAAVVFMILRILVGNEFAACAGALLWGLHPVQVEPVGWASGLKDVLCGLLSFVAIWQYLEFARRGGGRWRYAVAMLAFVLAMLSKPTALVLPLMVVALDHFGLQRPLKPILRAAAPWFVLMIPCLIWTKLSQSTIGVPTVSPWIRPLIAADALAFYLYKLVWPVNLGIDYGRRPTRVLAEGVLWFTWLVPLAVAVGIFAVRRSAPLLVAAGIVFIAGVLPVLGLIPFQFQYFSTVADHYLYISMLGPAIALAWLLSRDPRPLLWTATATVLLLLGMQSFRQGAHWKDGVTLFSRAIEINPRSFVGYNNLGSELFARGNRDEAEKHFRTAIRLFPDYGTAHDNLALVLLHRGERAEAIDHIKEVLRISGDMPPALRPNLDTAHVAFGGYLMAQHEYEQAAYHFREALRHNLDNAEAARGLESALERAREPATQPGPGTRPATNPAPG